MYFCKRAALAEYLTRKSQGWFASNLQATQLTQRITEARQIHEVEKWRRLAQQKNQELEKFRVELDAILDVLRELQKQGVVIPAPNSSGFGTTDSCWKTWLGRNWLEKQIFNIQSYVQKILLKITNVTLVNWITFWSYLESYLSKGRFALSNTPVILYVLYFVSNKVTCNFLKILVILRLFDKFSYH